LVVINSNYVKKVIQFLENHEIMSVKRYTVYAFGVSKREMLLENTINIVEM